jgi:hypothetical protein
MDANPYVIERMTAEYCQRRLAEAKNFRLLRTLRVLRAGETPAESRPLWCPLVLAFARGLIGLGRRLQAVAEPPAQPACETC